MKTTWVQAQEQVQIEGNVNVKAHNTSLEADQIEQMIGQDHVVHWELKRGEQADIERLINISCYRRILIKMDRPYAVNEQKSMNVFIFNNIIILTNCHLRNQWLFEVHLDTPLVSRQLV
ncbi:hypothetical protein LOK49_LG06G01164 [Camellia lanceoleosa]|uniref:Uncharacterized protein n=1 Tax=Camellia lanceoleosa TaxID=1840588 RepID=A0ACC0HCG4_9ERIC|nr:hypothetical protein LOK49_LG06G01164 [Camellia lanceoleosa]